MYINSLNKYSLLSLLYVIEHTCVVHIERRDSQYINVGNLQGPHITYTVYCKWYQRTHFQIYLLYYNMQVKGADYAVLDSYCRYVVTAGRALGIDIGGK